MHLDKYYLDVVSPSGEGWIGYSVKLHGARVTLGGALRWPADPAAPAKSQRTIRGALPVTSGAALTWRCPALDVSGTWTGLAAGTEEVLWMENGSGVRWQALADGARVALQLGAQSLSGLGYVERLSLNIAPWRLPIDGLHWGRFVSPAHRVVWIKWDHASPRQWLWHNGRAIAAAEIGARAITWPGHVLSLGASRTLRSGRLADTVFAHWHRVRRFLPARLRAWEEAKWCTAGTLVDAAEVSTRGWVIHEYVRLR